MKLFRDQATFAFALFFLCLDAAAQQSPAVWPAGPYTMYRDRIVQGKYVARAVSDKELVSDYISPANAFRSADISFKFSINGKDNEMKPGVDHHFICTGKDGHCETPVISFGRQLTHGSAPETYLAPNMQLKIRLDMREVMNAFRQQGYYTTYAGEKIYKDDFKGVYVAGSPAPLSWDFDNLVNHPQLRMQDPDGDGIYEVTLSMNEQEQVPATAARWQQSRDLSAFPAYASTYPISDALYNLAMEEMVNAIEPDSTFRTGKEWAGVWTRDISYSIILSMAHLQPAVARNSLLRKVNARKKIIQDTGTGGAWPVSTDRMIWAVAAWELYKVTGDKDWLQQAFLIIRNSIDADLHTVYDAQTGLVKGESSFLDWREQTYPRWMQPVDIAESECLGTNAVHYQANLVLGQMATTLGEKALAARYLAVASRIKKGINTYLWQPQRKYYGQYLYGRDSKILSPRSEALGEALCVVFGIAGDERARQVVANTPVMEYGIPCIYPQIADIPPYHNNAVWPFVQTYWLWAAAKVGHERSAMHSIAAIYRPAALFVTNKENFVAANGDFQGTQINSSNMLWSLSGSISIVHKVLFGIRFHESSLGFEPFVPKALAGTRTLSHFAYRKALLDLTLKGYGSRIRQFLLDGKALPAASLPATLQGHHTVTIILADQEPAAQPLNQLAAHTTLPTPALQYQDGRLQWQRSEGTKDFQVLKNGLLLKVTNETQLAVPATGFAAYQVIAIDSEGYASFASEPLVVVDTGRSQVEEAEEHAAPAAFPYKGYSGKGFVEISTTSNLRLSLPVTVAQEGTYAIDFRYANGNGPTNTENKCALRTLQVDGKAAGISLFPQRGKEEWSAWGFSNAQRVHLSKGSHTITLVYEEWNENMNGQINQAMIDYVRLVRTGP